MKVLMISIDKGLLGHGQLGDVVERHRVYAQACERLDIVVCGGTGFEPFVLSQNCTAHPTNSKSRRQYLSDGLRVAKKLFTTYQYDLIVTQEPFITGLLGLKLKKKFGSKLLVHFHGDFFSSYWLKEKIMNRGLLFLGLYIARRADAIRAVSSGIKKSLIRAGIAEERIHVISTPIDIQKFQHVDTAAVSQIKNQFQGRKIILTVGRNDPAKNFPLFFVMLDVLYKQRTDIGFIVAGAGFDAQVLAARYPGAIFVTSNKIPQADLISHYHACDVYVSTSNHESFGKVLIEASACAKPVVATATTGSQDIIADGMNGYLVPIGDDRALAEKVTYLLDNPAEAQEMGLRGKQIAFGEFNHHGEPIVTLWQTLAK